MGGSQSARKVTLDNPNPDPHDLNNVIRVSDNVVQRLKNPQYLSNAADAAGQTSEDKPKPMIGSPVSKPQFYSLRDEMRVHGLPYLTTKDIQEYVQSEVDQTNKYWEERMKKLQEGHKRMEEKMLDEYAKAQIELEKHLPRKIPEDAEVPCTDLSGDLAKCFKKNQKESLKCLPQIEAFKGCLSEARKHIVQVQG
uniref:Coiled-coil-helix-coiled-coil-helix domain-containing protein 3, mitochondrial n=1 Tax=Lygus hesperus TaxID=30085 RepID=A0A0A9W148_LYGHE